jgi:DNA-binding CsgD family transcriptional regulator
MATEWNIVVAVLFLIVLMLFLVWQSRRASRSRERQFNLTLDAPLVIGSPNWGALTARQQQVARLAARGLSNAEIAHQLGIKPHTVDAHLKKIYAALNVHSRAELSYQIKDHID